MCYPILFTSAIVMCVTIAFFVNNVGGAFMRYFIAILFKDKDKLPKKTFWSVFKEDPWYVVGLFIPLIAAYLLAFLTKNLYWYFLFCITIITGNLYSKKYFSNNEKNYENRKKQLEPLIEFLREEKKYSVKKIEMLLDYCDNYVKKCTGDTNLKSLVLSFVPIIISVIFDKITNPIEPDEMQFTYEVVASCLLLLSFIMFIWFIVWIVKEGIQKDKRKLKELADDLKDILFIYDVK